MALHSDHSHSNTATRSRDEESVRGGALYRRRRPSMAGGPTLQVLVQIGTEFLTSFSDGSVGVGPRHEAWIFASGRSAWAEMGRENVPTPLLRVARIFIVATPPPPNPSGAIGGFK